MTVFMCSSHWNALLILIIFNSFITLIYPLKDIDSLSGHSIGRYLVIDIVDQVVVCLEQILFAIVFGDVERGTRNSEAGRSASRTGSSAGDEDIGIPRDVSAGCARYASRGCAA